MQLIEISQNRARRIGDCNREPGNRGDAFRDAGGIGSTAVKQDLAFMNAGGIQVLRNHTLAPVSLDRDGDGIPDECQDRPFLRGDVDTDDHTNLNDASRLLDYLFAKGDSPPCQKAADVDDSGRLDVSDAVYLLMYLFAGGAPPPVPFNECGQDPTPDDLSCESFPGC